MRIGYLQFSPVFGDKKANHQRVADFLSGVKADLVVLPELFSTGYLFESKQELLSMAEDETGASHLFLKRLSADTGMAVVASIPELHGGGCYNLCLLCSEGRIAARYRKVHLFDREKELFKPGDLPFQVCELKGVKLGLLVCFDWIFPEATRVLALKGAQVICHPSNLVLSYCPQAMITRCIENGVFAVTTNRVGTESRAGMELTFIGLSQVIGPRGEILVRADEVEEDLRVIEIDPALAANKMITRRNHVIDDRRPEFYGDLCMEVPPRAPDL